MILEKTVFEASREADISAVKNVHRRAFERDYEPQLVEALLKAPCATLDMTASVDGTIVGHCLLTELSGQDRALALAPLAVDPDWRDFQIGTELVRRMIDLARRREWNSIFVLGDPVYYGRFGFKSELANCVECEFQCDEFQALELVPGALARYQGKLDYPAAFFAVAEI